MRSLHRLLRSRLIRTALFIFAVWNVVEVHYISQRLQRRAGDATLHESHSHSSSGSGSGADSNPESQSKRERRWQLGIDHLQASLHLQRPPRVYIASLHWNNENILRSHWNAAVLDLVRALGPANVFVAVHEGGSWDNSEGALHDLDKALGELGVPREILLDTKTHQDEISAQTASDAPGWIDTPRGRHELRRIPYLARLRNRSLEPLRKMAAAAGPGANSGVDENEEGEDAANTPSFDRVLFLNDVVFTVDDVLTLLATNDGQYAAACSLDFSRPPYYYDTFALRDRDGHEHATQTWPYFRSARSRRAMKLSLPVPVKSCWNGMVAMPVRPFTSAIAPPTAADADADASKDSKKTSSQTSQTSQSAQPLAFRGVDDSLALLHLEGSECCLIHADNPLSPTRGVFLNPNVRVGYNGPAYEAVNPADGRPWLSPFQILTGLWRNRFRRLLTSPAIKEWKVRRLIRRWVKEGRGRGETRVEKGDFCLINEMQVLVANGWAHV